MNLQFCNTIINYDLPWNPQKIEQRIGRCHRYGQKNDVVVINLLNTQNVADKRVYDMVNNITNQMVRNAPHFDRVLEYFVNFIENDTLVGHNICSFDMPFIYRDCERYLGKTISNDYIDTLRLARKVFPDWKHRRLSDLAEHMEFLRRMRTERLLIAG